MELSDAIGVLPVARDESELSYCGDTKGWTHEAGAALWRDPNVDHVEGRAKHSIVVGAVTLDVEGDVVVVIGSDDVVIDMHSCDVCVRIGLRRVPCQVYGGVKLSDDPVVPESVSGLVVKNLVGCIKVYQIPIGNNRPVHWV